MIGRVSTVNGPPAAVAVAEDILAGGVEDRAGLDVVLQVGEVGVHAGGLVVFDGVLVGRAVKHAQVFQDAGGLRALAGAQEVGDRDCGQEGDDGDHDHDFHERETATAGLEFLNHMDDCCCLWFLLPVAVMLVAMTPQAAPMPISPPLSFLASPHSLFLASSGRPAALI